MPAEPARVHLPGVQLGPPVDDPLGDEPAHAACAGQAVSAESGRDPEAAHVGRPEDELAVGRERLRTVHQPHDLGVLERGHPDHRVVHQGLETLPVLVEQLPVEVGRDPIHPPWRRVSLVAAHDEPAGLRAEIDEKGWVTHGRHIQPQPARSCDQVLVGHRYQRHIHPGEAPDLRREHAPGVDDQISVDGAAIGDNAAHGVPGELDGGHSCVFADLRAPLPGPGDQSERELAGVDVAVGAQIGGSEHAFSRHGWKELLGLLGRDQLQRKAERLRPTRLAGQLLHPLLARRQAQRPDLVPAGLEAGLRLEVPVEVDRVHHHPGQAERAAQLPYQARRVEGRAAGEL